jgi:purine-nucleoside phosphorylase
MEKSMTLAQINAAADFIRGRTENRPTIGLILGSGLGALADQVQGADHVPFDEIPHFPVSTVAGHSGRMVIGQLEGQPVLVMQGRVHYYEGYSMSQVTFPIRVMQALGIGTLVVTNAAGGLDTSWSPGDLMLIRDHINLVGMVGMNPLRGPNLDTFGPRFPDMSRAYSPELRQLAREVAEQEGILMHEGVYIGLAGPNYETPAELHFMRQIGADAVGMSTVAEVTVACHGGMRVLGISGISNIVIYDPSQQGEAPNHEEVLEAGLQAVPKLMAIIKGVLRRLPPGD